MLKNNYQYVLQYPPPKQQQHQQHQIETKQTHVPQVLIIIMEEPHKTFSLHFLTFYTTGFEDNAPINL